MQDYTQATEKVQVSASKEKELSELVQAFNKFEISEARKTTINTDFDQTKTDESEMDLVQKSINSRIKKINSSLSPKERNEEGFRILEKEAPRDYQ